MKIGHPGTLAAHLPASAWQRFAMLIAVALLLSIAAAGASAAEEAAPGGIGFVFSYMAKNPFVFLFVSLAIGYPLGRIKVGGISLGSTAGTLVVGIILALVASAAFGITYEIPGLLQDTFLLMFMYALGMRVGPASTS